MTKPLVKYFLASMILMTFGVNFVVADDSDPVTVSHGY